MRVVHVSEVGLSDAELASLTPFRIRYQFVTEDRRDGFSAWEVPGSESGICVDVLNDARDCNGGYRQFALNRLVAKQLVKHQAQLLVIEGLYGCTLDLPRVAGVLGVPCVWKTSAENRPLPEPDRYLKETLASAITACDAVFVDPATRTWFDEAAITSPTSPLKDSAQWPEYIESLESAGNPAPRQRLVLHPMLDRDPTLLTRMQTPDLVHFEHSKSVLDVGCGVGIFLDLLRRRGVDAIGVERDATVAAYGRGSGLDIEASDALTFLRQTSKRFDGLYCSHFIEHLPVDTAQALLDVMSARLEPGGVLLLVFPDPESIRTQLLGFWRDPEHVRLYHPELVIAMAEAAGLDLEWSSYLEQPHAVAPFAPSPPEIALPEPVRVAPTKLSFPEGALDRLLARLGLASLSRNRQLEAQISALGEALDEHAKHTAQTLRALEERTRALWAVNQTWAWNDNVTLKLRKPAEEV